MPCVCEVNSATSCSAFCGVDDLPTSLGSGSTLNLILLPCCFCPQLLERYLEVKLILLQVRYENLTEMQALPQAWEKVLQHSLQSMVEGNNEDVAPAVLPLNLEALLLDMTHTFQVFYHF